MGLFTPFTRRLRPERSAFPLSPLPIDPAEQRALDELRARREEQRRRSLEESANG